MRSPSSPDLIRILLGWLLGPCSLMDLNERMAGISYKKRYITFGEKDACCLLRRCLVRVAAGEHTQVDTISFRIHGKGGGVRFYRSPIQIGVIPFEFRISQAFKTFAGDSIVVVFLPEIP